MHSLSIKPSRVGNAVIMIMGARFSRSLLTRKCNESDEACLRAL